MNLIRYYNQNRRKVWGILIIIVSAFVLLQVVNYIHKSNLEKTQRQGNQAQNRILNTTINNTTKITNEKSVVTGEKIENQELKTATEKINEFITACNNQELEKAYNLLTDDCKNQLYRTQENFEKAYYDNVFEGERKNCTVENWVGNTYKVRIVEDILASGKSNNGYAKQDYITVQKVENEYKLNINNFIRSREINKTTENNNLTIEVIKENIYKDYEEVVIKATNHTENTILLDGRSEAETLYLQDSKGKKYSSYSHELTDPRLTIEEGQTKEITIKFYSSYISTKKIEDIIFSDIIMSNGELSEKLEMRVNM